MDNEELLNRLLESVEAGKVNKDASFPPAMKGQDGADELTREAIAMGIKPADILEKALIKAMENVGRKFSEKKIFVPQMLVSAKAMNAALLHLKPFFTSGEVSRKGRFVIGTVSGDLHDIGKNLVAMIVEGAGWEVIDLGVDVSAARFMQVIQSDQKTVVGLSALLTTTMVNMKNTVSEIKSKFPQVRVLIGGAPVNENFRVEIGADGYAHDPQSAVSYLNSLVA